MAALRRVMVVAVEASLWCCEDEAVFLVDPKEMES